MALLKQIAALMPSRWQNELKRLHFGRQIKKEAFVTSEPEFNILNKLITPGDWVIDIGANVGIYTKRFSDMVGPNGRVIAFEPVPTTFSLLAANVQLFTNHNVSLINAAVSDKLNIVGMSIPKFSSGLTNYYEARLSSDQIGSLSVLTLSLDSLCITQRIALVKIDVEGHESFVLSGMQKLIEKHHPILIVETDSKDVIDRLKSHGYIPEKSHNSPNIVFMPSLNFMKQ